jgi:hypothetical protein
MPFTSGFLQRTQLKEDKIEIALQFWSRFGVIEGLRTVRPRAISRESDGRHPTTSILGAKPLDEATHTAEASVCKVSRKELPLLASGPHNANAGAIWLIWPWQVITCCTGYNLLLHVITTMSVNEIL